MTGQDPASDPPAMPLSLHDMADGEWRYPSVVDTHNIVGTGQEAVDGDMATSVEITDSSAGGYVVLDPLADYVLSYKFRFADASGTRDILMTPWDGSRDQIGRITTNGLSGPTYYYAGVNGFGAEIALGNFVATGSFYLSDAQVYVPAEQVE